MTIPDLNQRIEETGAQLAHYQQQQEKFTSDYWNFRQRCNHYDQMVKEKGEADQSVLKFKQEQEKLCPVINNMVSTTDHFFIGCVILQFSGCF